MVPFEMVPMTFEFKDGADLTRQRPSHRTTYLLRGELSTTSPEPFGGKALDVPGSKDSTVTSSGEGDVAGGAAGAAGAAGAGGEETSKPNKSKESSCSVIQDLCLDLAIPHTAAVPS